VSEEEYHDDEIDESYKSKIKFECDVYLLNYTIQIKNLNWAFEGFKVFLNLKTRIFKTQFYSPGYRVA